MRYSPTPVKIVQSLRRRDFRFGLGVEKAFVGVWVDVV
jgi:hypothetical protein